MFDKYSNMLESVEYYDLWNNLDIARLGKNSAGLGSS